MAQNDNNNNPAGAGGSDAGVVVEPGKAADALTPELKEEAKKIFEKLTPEQIEELKKAAKKPVPAKKGEEEVSTGAGSEASDDDDPWYTDVRFWIGLGAGAALAGCIWLAIELFFGESEEAIDIPA